MKRLTASDITTRALIHFVLAGAALLCIIPLVTVLSISVSDERAIVQSGYSLLPREMTWDAYRAVFQGSRQLYDAYRVTVTVTVVGTLLSLLVTSMLAYAISKRDFAYRNVISLLVFFTMLFNGGVVPFYIVVSSVLGLKDTLWALILPYLCNSWNIIVLRTYFRRIPFEMIESARIDGAGEFRTLFQIVYPVSKPGLAAIGLIICLQYWNDWWLSLLFTTRSHLMSLQLLLTNMIQNIDFVARNIYRVNVDLREATLPTEAIRMAMCILAIGPIAFAYPFFQRYFVKGLTVGAVKG